MSALNLIKVERDQEIQRVVAGRGTSFASILGLGGAVKEHQLSVSSLGLQFRCDDVIRCSDKDRQKIAEIMFETYNVQALCIKPQPLLAMYSYGATTGVVVDIGERLDIFPLDSGYMFEKGVSKLRYAWQIPPQPPPPPSLTSFFLVYLKMWWGNGDS